MGQPRQRRREPIRRSAWGGLGAALLMMLAVAATAQPLFGPAQDPVAGRKLFETRGCVKCHAVRGVGGKIGPDLARIQPPRTFYDVAAALWNHAPRMAWRMRQFGIARPRLDARESGDVVAYLFTLSYFDRPGDARAGHRLFGDKGCVRCHRAGGAGGTVGPPLDAFKHYASPIVLATAMWNHSGPMMQAMAARGVPRPTFEGSELIDLIAYLNSASSAPRTPLYVLAGRADEGRRLFIGKRCAECHGGSGQGPPGVVALAERHADRSLTQFAAAMWNKAPLMLQAMEGRLPAPPVLRPEEMADIVAYLYSVRYFAQAGDPHNGARVLVNKGCLNCHGLYGERGKSAGDLAQARGVDTPGGVLSALWNHSFIADPRISPEKAPWPVFRGEEMADLVAYLRSTAATR